MPYTIIIPSRYSSERLPGKALKEIAGKPMIQRVYEQASKSSAKEVLVATDDKRIADAVRDFGGQFVMTRSSHQSGTDRLQQVVQEKSYADDHVIVNVQGDEPLIPPAAIDQVAELLLADCEVKNNRGYAKGTGDKQRNTLKAGMATLCEPITDADTLFDPNAVKVVRNTQGFALYFSRAPIPWQRGWAPLTDEMDEQQKEQAMAKALTEGIQWFRHIGIYAYRVEVLNQFVDWPMSRLECAESLEQLRVLENGVSIRCAEASVNMPAGVDTAEDLARVRLHFDQQ